MFEMSPEMKAQLELDALTAQKKVETVVKSTLPIVKEARRALRECVSHGLRHEHLHDAMRSLAVLEDDLETALVTPPAKVRL